MRRSSFTSHTVSSPSLISVQWLSALPVNATFSAASGSATRNVFTLVFSILYSSTPRCLTMPCRMEASCRNTAWIHGSTRSTSNESVQSPCNRRNASTPRSRMPACLGSSCDTPSRSFMYTRMPCSGMMNNWPFSLVASRIATRGTCQLSVFSSPAPARLISNCALPSVLPLRCSVTTVSSPSSMSVQWLSALPVIDSTSSPSGNTKLSLNTPARVTRAARFTSSTLRSSPSDSRWLLVMRMSA